MTSSPEQGPEHTTPQLADSQWYANASGQQLPPENKEAIVTSPLFPNIEETTIVSPVLSEFTVEKQSGKKE